MPKPNHGVKDTGELIGQQLSFRPRNNRDDQETHSDADAIDFTGDPGLTIQEPKEDSDINVLMKRMGVTDGSKLPRFENPMAIYGDFTELPDDPTEMANMMREGNLAFMRLPAELRKRYETPEKLFEFMNDDSNYEEAVKLGLLQKRPAPKPDKIDKLIEKMDTFVSSSTSSDKEPLVPTSKSSSKGDKNG